MKVSLAWIFDHIEGSVRNVDIPNLVARFNECVAEIEGYHTWHLSPDHLEFVRVIDRADTYIVTRSIHTEKAYRLPLRLDLEVDDIALVWHEQGTTQWARMNNLGSSKESFLPSIDAQHTDWKMIELSDVILEIDNKSITHRPDLWSHRGLAREIAALLDLPLTNLGTICTSIPVHRFIDTPYHISDDFPYLSIEKKVPCRRLVAAYLPVAWHPSFLSIMARLCRTDIRPIDAIVDLTNYTMLDYGQPMHAFDAASLHGDKLSARYAHVGENIALLDGDRIQLHPHDMVLVDTHGVISLPGVMGGLHTGVSRTTQKILIEAGSFEPEAIRHTATRYTKRTEAAMRFEKNLDPEMPVWALKRYITLLTVHGLLDQTIPGIIDYGPPVEPIIITTLHTTIEQRLGMQIQPAEVLHILEKLSFKIKQAVINGGDGYSIEVPSFRATKDIRIAEDIIEEVGRYIGYKNIPTKLPYMARTPTIADSVHRLRAIKHYCASSLYMKEISSYAFYDESWLTFMRWQPAKTLEALNPVSGNWRRLITSLIPALLKAVHDNSEGISDIRYFEGGRTWIHQSPVLEKKELAGVIYTRSTADFYTLKEYVQQLCAHIGIQLTWRRPAAEMVAVWYDPYCVAQCMAGNTVVGMVGLVSQTWKDRVVQTGFLGIFELDLNFLTSVQLPVKQYQPLPKYPDIVRDVSVRISQTMIAAEIQSKIQEIDPRIYEVTLVDFFKKPEWHSSISLSFRYIIRDTSKTLTTAEADIISNAVDQLLIDLGGEIR